MKRVMKIAWLVSIITLTRLATLLMGWVCLGIQAIQLIPEEIRQTRFWIAKEVNKLGWPICAQCGGQIHPDNFDTILEYKGKPYCEACWPDPPKPNNK